MTNFDKELFIEWCRMVLSASVLFILFCLMCAMCGCKSQEPMVERHYHTTMQTDSLTRLLSRLVSQQTNTNERLVVLEKERIVYTVNEDGDTIGTDRDHEVDRSYALERQNERLLIENDSLRSVAERRDTVYREMPYPVERTLTRWESAKMNLGGIAFGAVGALVVAFIIVWLIKRKMQG